METLTTKDPDRILKLFENEANLEVQNGWIYLVGGILSKLQDNKHFIAIKYRIKSKKNDNNRKRRK